MPTLEELNDLHFELDRGIITLEQFNKRLKELENKESITFRL